jgi:hypothetical protein
VAPGCIEAARRHKPGQHFFFGAFFGAAFLAFLVAMDSFSLNMKLLRFFNRNQILI